MKKLVVGVLGAGRIGKVHTLNALRMQDVEVKMIADPYMNEETIEWANALGIEVVTKNTELIFQDKSINAVFICSSSDSHADFIVKAAKAGKHIFCEKPIHYDIQKIIDALDECENADVKLQVGFMRRFDHNHLKVHESVKAGLIGDPHIIRISSRDPQSPPIEYVQHCGGFFYDMTIHDFDLARYITCSEITEVYAMGSVQFDQRLHEVGDIDTCLIALKFENGAFGTIDNSRESNYGYDQRNEVFGSKGKIEISNDVPNSAVISTKESVISEKPYWFFMDRYNDAFYAELESFVSCVLEDKEPVVTGIDGLKPVICAMAAERSLKESRPVKISEIEALYF